MQGDKVLSEIYFHLGRTDSAYLYLNNYIQLKDSILNRQFLFRINNYKKAAEDAKKESRIGFLNRDNQIKEQQLKQQTLFRNFLFVGLIAVILIGVFVYRTLVLKRKNEKLQLKNELDRQISK